MLPTVRAIVLMLLLAVPLEFPVAQEKNSGQKRQYDSRALSHYLDADLAMLQGEYRQAVASYELALRYDSSSATIYLGLAEALMQLGRPQRANHAARKALELQPDDPLVHELLARNAAAREDYPAALRHLDEWARLDPTQIDPLFHKAALQVKLNKINDAIDTYLLIADRDPGQIHVLPRAGELALSVGDLEKAYLVYQRLHQLRPDDWQVSRTFAEICLRTERYQEALEIYEQLSASGAASTANRLQLAWLYTQVKEMESALGVIAALLEEGHRQWEVLSTYGGIASELGNYQELARVSQLMREIYPDSTGGYTGLAIARSYQDDLKGAIEVMEEAIARFPAHTDVNYLLGRLYYDAERYMDAEGPLLGALARNPSARYIKRILASTWASLEKFRASDSLYEVLLISDHDDPVTLNNYAYSLADRSNPSRKQLKLARKMSKRSLKLQPGNSSFLDTYGWIWYQLGRYRKARKYIAQSLEANGENAIVLDHFGEVYLRLGNRDQAEEYFRQAREIRKSGQPTEVRASDE